MTDTAALIERYRATLQTYLAAGAEDALQQANEIGREALDAAIGPARALLDPQGRCPEPAAAAG